MNKKKKRELDLDIQNKILLNKILQELKKINGH